MLGDRHVSKPFNAYFVLTFRELTTYASFHCLFCHGYEERGCVSAGLLAVGDVANPMVAIHFARMAKRFATTVTLYTDGAEELAQTLKESARGTGIKVDMRKISKLAKGPGESDVQVIFEDGTQVTEGFLVSTCHLVVLESNANHH